MRRLWGNRRTGRSPDTLGPDCNEATSRPQFGRGPTPEPLINPDREVNYTMSHKPVIIVGGGPVGLAAALELARFNVPSIVVEQHDSTSRHPKTRNFNTRTMEIARGWGCAVYQRLRGIDTRRVGRARSGF